MQAFPIQLAKVQRPPLRAATLHRPRLVGWLDRNIARRVMFVTAEAGYGKTTLLADYSRRARGRILWFRIDDDDANWVSFINYLIAAGRQADPEFATGTLALLAEVPTGGEDRDLIVSTFIAELRPLVSTTPTILIFDDYHLVDDVPEIKAFVRELTTRAPEGMRFVFLSRRTPTVPVSRLRSAGEVVELHSDDLRFRLDETEQLFRDAYQRSVEPDVIQTLTERTEGWAASLQLVDAALRDRSTSEVRSFVRGLTGARGDLYDYLAEEVVGDLDASTQQFLMHTSILQDVDAGAAALVTRLDPRAVADVLRGVEQLGLVARRGPGREGPHRYHPLVREFLEARLRAEEGDEAVIALHRLVAEAHEETNWRVAAHHYAAIESPTDLHRILIGNAATIMAAGEFDLATSYVDLLDDQLVEPVFDLFRSRVEIVTGDTTSALAMGKNAYNALHASASPLVHLAHANLITLKTLVGDLEGAHGLATELAASRAPDHLRDIANATVASLEASTTGSLERYEQLLLRMEAEQRRNDRSHYLAVTTLNLGLTALTQGRMRLGLNRAITACDLLQSGHDTELAAAIMARAWGLAHLGDWEGARAQMRAAERFEGPGHGEALAESAALWSWYGGSTEAGRLLDQASRAVPTTTVVRDMLPVTKAELLLRSLELDAAGLAVRGFGAGRLSTIVGQQARLRLVETRWAVLSKAPHAEEIVATAIDACVQEGTGFVSASMKILEATLSGTEALNATLRAALSEDPAYVSIEAEAVLARIHDLSSGTFASLTVEAQRRPERWRDALRVWLARPGPESPRAAEILEQIGDPSDIALLRSLAKATRGRGGTAKFGKSLARRLAPKVLIEDLGRVRIRVDGALIQESEIRRRVLGFVSYLITRPELSATRDEVIDALWPDTDPSSAINSLNQTVYFLRRVFEPGYSEDVSANYVHHDSDVIWLDGELVTSRSLVCRQLVAAVATDGRAEDVLALSREYRGKFALDFMYEEWAIAHRDSLHAAYLESIEGAILKWINAGSAPEAIAVARRALEIDPASEELERLLLISYHAAGASAAVEEQYEHYAAVLKNDLGVDPPVLSELLRTAREPQ